MLGLLAAIGEALQVCLEEPIHPFFDVLLAQVALAHEAETLHLGDEYGLSLAPDRVDLFRAEEAFAEKVPVFPVRALRVSHVCAPISCRLPAASVTDA